MEIISINKINGIDAKEIDRVFTTMQLIDDYWVALRKWADMVVEHLESDTTIDVRDICGISYGDELIMPYKNVAMIAANLHGLILRVRKLAYDLKDRANIELNEDILKALEIICNEISMFVAEALCHNIIGDRQGLNDIQYLIFQTKQEIDDIMEDMSKEEEGE